MGLYWYLIVYFLAGVLQDFLFTMNLRYVAKNKVLLAMLVSFLVTVVNLVVLYNILTQLNPNETMSAIIFYAFGITAGTFLAMKFKVGLSD